MRKILIAAVLLLTATLNAQQPLCSTTDKQNEWFKTHPELKASFEKLQNDAAQLDHQMFQQGYKQMGAKSSASNYTIPVVFHILHLGGGENISDAQIKDAVNILTRDFNSQNTDTSYVVGPFKNKIGNAQISFALATKDPAGNCTNGITRHFDVKSDWDSDYSSYKYSWPPSRYLNIYVVRTMENGSAGYTFLPGSGVPPAMDAIVILQNYVGSIGTGQPGLSRALTHEVGHWLNLPHTWGNSNQPGVTCGDDGVSDTPVTKGFTNCNLNNSTICTPGVTENMQNYMDYAYCQRMFTTGQAVRMQQAINNGVNNRNNLSTTSNLAITGANSPVSVCAPVLEISASGYTVCAGKPLSFSSFTSNGNPTNYAWTTDATAVFQSSNSANPQITFLTPGTATVTCVAGNNNGSDAATLTITVNEPWADFTGNATESFENNLGALPGNWTQTKSSNFGWVTTSLTASEGMNSIYVKGESMAANAVAVLESPSYDFKYNQGAIFSFKYAYRRASSNNKDVFIVQATSDCGGSWQDIYWPSPSTMADKSGGTGSSVFVPAPNGAEWEFYDITSHPAFISLLEESNVRFRFYFKEDPDGAGNGNRLYLDEINFAAPVGVNELTRSVDFNVYPNPSAGAISVDFNLSNESKVGYKVFSVSGSEVLSQPENNFGPGAHKLSLNSEKQLSPGIYFVNVAINGATMSKKIIVQ